ncbi:MAG: Uma2 family endonuclease [Bryobacterales bacterium]|nr:Uma2 family endonuclease [Bryobacterales bacterium]
MQTTLLSVEEYLASHYRPDCDYVDGELEERNVGERDHSFVQAALIKYFAPLEQSLRLHVFPELRVRVGPKRFRVPDICVVLGDFPSEQVLTQPPFLCVEILSPSDTLDRLQERIDDYLAMGVLCVWLLNPRTRRGWVYTGEGSREAKDGILHTANPDLAVPLAALFPAD